MRTLSLALAVFSLCAVAAAQETEADAVDGGAPETSPAPAAEEGPPALVRLTLAECTARAIANSKELAAERHRLDALQAAVLSVKLKHLDAWTAARQGNAADYARLFRASPIRDEVGLPQPAAATTRHVYNQYCIRLPAARRNTVWDGLKAAGVGCEVYYPVPLHLQQCFAALGGRAGDCPKSERAAQESLALPIYPESTHEQRVYVVDTIARLLQAGRS